MLVATLRLKINASARCYFIILVSVDGMQWGKEIYTQLEYKWDKMNRHLDKLLS